MSSVNIFEYSLLTIKKTEILKAFFYSEELLAKHIFFFGGEDRFKGLFSFKGENFLDKKSLFKKKPLSFLQLFSLEELDGNSPEIINKKQQIWTKLQKWKRQFEY